MTTMVPADMAAELTQAADSLVQRELTRPEVRTAARAGWSADLWAATAAAGWFELLAGEEHGGLGLGPAAAAGLLLASSAVSSCRARTSITSSCCQ